MDAGPFVLALIDPLAYEDSFPGCDIGRGDLNGDGTLDGNDIREFVQAALLP
jgi:hypothetical protein